jgi:ASCH domain-containing protein
MLSGLLIRTPWIDLILEGSKIWEIPGKSTDKRGRLALIQSGTGTVVGVAELVAARLPN